MEREDEDVLSSRNGGEAPDNKHIDDKKNIKKTIIGKRFHLPYNTTVMNNCQNAVQEYFLAVLRKTQFGNDVYKNR